MKRISIILVIGLIAFGCGEAEKKEDKESPPASVSTDRMETGASVQPDPDKPEAPKKKTGREKLSEEEVDGLIAAARTGLDRQSLREASSGPNPIVLLGRSRDPRAIPVLREIIVRSKEPLARRQAARALGMIDAPEATEALKPALKDEYIWVRLTAALSLARQGEKDEPLAVFSEIITRQGVDDWKIITRSVSDGPGEISEEEMTRRTENLDKLKNQTLPLLALTGLSRIQTPEALEIVKIALESENPYVKRKAEKILKQTVE